jgi:hypothetical protein
MNKHKFIIFMVLLMSITIIISGCSGSDMLLDEQGNEVSFENQDKPSLIFFFTGVG